eukprot:9226725-Pyramimonas_sp.AAC.1
MPPRGCRSQRGHAWPRRLAPRRRQHEQRGSNGRSRGRMRGESTLTDSSASCCLRNSRQPLMQLQST